MLSNDSEIIKKIHNLNEKIREEIYRLNQGGCGIFADELYKVLVKLGFQPKIAIKAGVIPFEERKKFINETMNNNFENSSKTAFSHCMIQLENFLIDGYNCCEGNRIEDGFQIMPFEINGYYTKDELEIAIAYADWNENYSRSQTPKLINLIEKYIC